LISVREVWEGAMGIEGPGQQRGPGRPIAVQAMPFAGKTIKKFGPFTSKTHLPDEPREHPDHTESKQGKRPVPMSLNRNEGGEGFSFYRKRKKKQTPVSDSVLENSLVMQRVRTRRSICWSAKRGDGTMPYIKKEQKKKKKKKRGGREGR